MTSLTTMYAGQTNSPATTLAANITSTATSISVTDASALPAVPFPLTIGINSTSSETVLVTAKSGNTLTVTRGWDGTASAWNADTPCARVFTAKDLNIAQSNITALNTDKAGKTEVNNSIEQLYEDVFSPSASGSIATFERITGGMPVNSLEVAITPKQAGSGDPSPTNVRAISGWTAANVRRTDGCVWGGEQMADDMVAAINNTTVCEKGSDTDGNYVRLTAATGIGSHTLFKVPKPAVYTLIVKMKRNTANALLNWRFYYTDGTYSNSALPSVPTADTVVTAAITTPSGKLLDHIEDVWATGVSYFYYEDCGLFEGTLTASDFTPYQGVSKNISFGQTVYGGTLNVTTGVLQPTHYIFTLNGTEASYGMSTSSGVRYFTYSPLPYTSVNTSGVNDNYWSSMFMMQTGVVVGHSYVTGAGVALVWVVDQTITTVDQMKAYFASNNAQFVLPLATLPDPIQLTPEQVSTLQGTNNIWADTGDVIEVAFGEDIKQYIDAENADKQDEIIVSGILKGDGAGGISAAVAGTDYQAPLTAGTDYQTPLDEKALQWYGVCSTSASTQAKTVSITGITALTEGLEIRVKMTNAQTYNGTPTLNVNSLGAKTIKQHGSTDAVRYQWQAGEVISFTYDGTYWVIENNSLATTTYFGLTRLSSATNSAAEDCAATPNAVKTAYDLADAAIPATEKGTKVATLATAADSTTPSVPRITPAQSFAPIFDITADTTLAAKHAGGILKCTNSPTITIPANVFAEATQIEILNYGTGVVTVQGASGCSLNGTSAGSKQITDQYSSGVLLAISASQWVIQGAIS